MSRVLPVIFLLISSPFMTGARLQEKEAAFYEMTVNLNGKPLVSQAGPERFLFRKKGNAVEIIDLTSGTKLQGTTHSNHTMTFVLKDDTKATTLYAYAGAAHHRSDALLIYGAVGDQTISWPLQTSGDPNAVIVMEWTELPSVWACSNHQDPTHTAKSEEELRSQTEKNKCQGWHKLKPSDIE